METKGCITLSYLFQFFTQSLIFSNDFFHSFSFRFLTHTQLALQIKFHSFHFRLNIKQFVKTRLHCSVDFRFPFLKHSSYSYLAQGTFHHIVKYILKVQSTFNHAVCYAKMKFCLSYFVCGIFVYFISGIFKQFCANQYQQACYSIL